MQEEPTDAQLVMRARADDMDAFTLLIERYQVMLIYIALRKVGNEEIARDLVQEPLLHAYLSLDQLHDVACFKNWLYGIALNLCHNWIRTHKGGARALTTSLDEDASSINVRCEILDQGKLWIDGFQFERVDKSVPLTGTLQLLPPLRHPHNLNFARDLENWYFVGDFAQDYTFGIDYAATADGTPCAYLKANRPEPRGSVLSLCKR